MQPQLEELERRLGYTFADRALLLRALTHKSLLAELQPDDESRDNEQLEFLGDSILGFLSSDAVLRLCPEYPEGKLSKLKAHLVSSVHLHEVACALDLGPYLILGRGEEMSGGREKKALLANAVEAIIAAIYLDAGAAAGMEACRVFVERHVFNGLELEEIGRAAVPVDPKSALQEFAQAHKLSVPRYHIVREAGPEHAKLFTVEARVGKDLHAEAEGTSKKSAGRLAAELLLAQIASQAESEL